MRLWKLAWLLALVAGRAWSAQAEAGTNFVTQARWIYVEHAGGGRPPAPAFVRIGFDVPADEKATNAWFYVFQNGADGIWVNGERANAKTPPEFARYGGWIKGVKVSFAESVRAGRNVLAFRLKDRDPTYQGMILRGEVAFASGKRVRLFSNATMAKASAEGPDGWTGVAFDDSSWRPAFERGDVMMAQWKWAGPVDRIYATPEELADIRAQCTKGFPEQRLLSEPDSPNARVVYRGSVPGVEINGEVLPPYTMSEMQFGVSELTKERDQVLTACRDDGIRFICVTRFWMSTYCCGEGQYDFDELDTGIRTLLARYPEAYVVLYFRNGVKAPDWWTRKHPDELCGFAIRLPNSKDDSSNWSNPDVPSLASEEYRRLQRDFIAALGRYARERPWGRRIAGIHCGYGSSGDGMPSGCQALPDTGRRMTEAFRRHLAETYGSDAALRKAWGDPNVTLGTAEVPDREARKGSGLWIRDLSDARDRRLADYLECYHRVFSSFIVDFGRSVKEAFPGCLAGAYHGYTLLGYNSEGMTARYREILRSPHIDYMWATVHGNSRMDGMTRHLVSSFHRYGKLSSMEGDDRIYRAYLPGQEANRAMKPLSEVTNSAHYHTPRESRSTMTKLVGNALIDGCGYQMVDFGKNGVKWFNCPEAREPLAASVAEWRRNWNDPPKPAADVAVVVDPDQIWKGGYSEEMYTHYLQGCLVDLARQSLNFSGYAVDTYTPEDFLDARRDYKAVVFLNLYEADDALGTALGKKVGRKGATAIWCHAPGIRTDAGYSEANMEKLTGIRLKIRRERLPLVARDAQGRDFSSFTGGSMYSAPHGQKVIAPRVSADDPKAEVLATYVDDGSAALVRKRLPSGAVSVFTGIPVNDPARWAELLAAAGCHAWTPPGFYVRRDSRHLMVYSGKGRGATPGWANDVLKGKLDESGSVEVRLERRCAEVKDAMTGEVLARDADRFALESDVPRTWLMQVTEAKKATRGVLCLTFDDSDFGGWVRSIPLFAAYDAHASFFAYGVWGPDELDKLRRLAAAGHTVGIHTVHHCDAPPGFARMGAQGYGRTEIDPMLAWFAQGGLKVRHMAYPNNRRDEETDAYLSSAFGFQRFRAGAKGCFRYNTNGTSIVALDAAFFPVSELARHRVMGGVGVGEYYVTDIEDICKGVRRAAERDEVFTIFSHGISRYATGVSMKTGWLERILQTARDCNVAVRGFDELGPVERASEAVVRGPAKGTGDAAGKEERR